MDKKAAFLKTIAEQQRLIVKIASVYADTVEDRNDLIQEITYQLWKSFDTFGERSSITTWMYKVAMNTAIYYLKVNRRKVKTFSLSELSIEVREPANAESDENWLMLRQQIDQLNLLDKGIVLLYLENKSHQEIAHIIGISTSNVGTKLSRIKEKLKQKIQPK